jgi:hypothetical protein
MSNTLMEFDHEVEYKYWPHLADTVTIEEVVSDEELRYRHSQTEANKKKELGLEQWFLKEAC